MIIETFPSGPLETNAYLLACSETKQGAVIDTPFQSFSSVNEAIKRHGIKIKIILITHSHWDHIGDIQLFKKEFGAPVYIHSEDAPNLSNPGSDRLPAFLPLLGLQPDQYLKDGQVLTLGNLEIEVIHTPGHSPGGCCFYLKKQNVLFSGDTLFRGTIGRLDLPTGSSERMWPSLKKLAKLPPETKVFPGHGEETTIGDEDWLSQAKQKFGD